MTNKIETYGKKLPLGDFNELHNKNFININSIVAQRKERQLWGGGVIIKSSEDEESEVTKRFIDLINKNQLIERQLPFIETELSINGSGMVLVLPDSTGKDFRIITSNNNLLLGSEIANDIKNPSGDFDVNWIQRDDFGVVTWARTMSTINYGTIQIFVIQEWSINGMTTLVNNAVQLEGMNSRPLDDKYKNKDGSYNVSKLNELLPNTYKIQESWDYHKLGFIPMIVFDNYPTVAQRAPSDSSNYSFANEIYNETVIAKVKELRNNQTQVFGQNTLGINAMDTTNRTAVPKTSGKDNSDLIGNLDILMGDPVLDKYDAALNFVVDKAFSYAGLSELYSTQSQETVVGTEYTKVGDQETMAFLRKWRTKQVNLFLKMLQAIDTFINGTKYPEDVLISIDMKSNTITDVKTKIELAKAMAELNIASTNKAVSYLYNTEDSKEIEKIKKEIENTEQSSQREEKMLDKQNSMKGNNSENKTKNKTSN